MSKQAKRVVYIAAPFTTEDPEVFELFKHTARYFGLAVARIGHVPLMPTVNTGYGFRSTQSPGFWYEATMKLLEKSDAIFVVPGSVSVFQSSGVLAEERAAEMLGIPVFYDLESLGGWQI